VKNLEHTEFKRLCGVTLGTFEQMVKVVAAEKVLAKKSGRPSKLSIEDQVLMTKRVLARVSHLFSYRGKLGIVGNKCIEKYQES
jgi:hypothetical protein